MDYVSVASMATRGIKTFSIGLAMIAVFASAAKSGLAAPIVYAIDENIEVHFVMRGQREWSMVYHGGLFLDAKYRIN